MHRPLGWCTQIFCGQVTTWQVRAVSPMLRITTGPLQHTGEPGEYSVLNPTSPIEGPALFPMQITAHETKTNSTPNTQTCASCIQQCKCSQRRDTLDCMLLWQRRSRCVCGWRPRAAPGLCRWQSRHRFVSVRQQVLLSLHTVTTCKMAELRYTYLRYENEELGSHAAVNTTGALHVARRANSIKEAVD